MATIRRYRDKWQVQVRIKGHLPRSKSFHSKRDADQWAIRTESMLQRGEHHGLSLEASEITVRDLLIRYRDTITVAKRSADNETYTINALLRAAFTRVAIRNLSPADVVTYRELRIRKVKPATFNREIQVLSHAFDLARKEWGIAVLNPLADIRRGGNTLARNRRLEGDEKQRLLEECKKCRNPHVRQVIEFAIETGMRRGEMLAAQWKHVNWERRTLLIPVTKTDVPRTIPLTSRALEILRHQVDRKVNRPFPLTAESVKLAWKRLVIRADITDLHFHDLRHEAISRFFERGLSVPEVALISGHKDYRMLARYTHLRAEDVAAKLG